MLTYHFIVADFPSSPGWAQPIVGERIFNYLTWETFFHFGTFSQTCPYRGARRLRPLTWTVEAYLSSAAPPFILWEPKDWQSDTFLYLSHPPPAPPSLPAAPPFIEQRLMRSRALDLAKDERSCHRSRSIFTGIPLESKQSEKFGQSLKFLCKYTTWLLIRTAFGWCTSLITCVSIGTRWSMDEVATSDKTWE